MRPGSHIARRRSAAARAAGIPLPRWRYLPGRNERHREGAFEHVKSLGPEKTDDRSATENVAWLYGIRLFNEAFFWEAHEVLESVWMRAAPNSRERWLVQCVIHLANGALKLAVGNTRAAVRLATLAEECRERAFAGKAAAVMGLAALAVKDGCARLAVGQTAGRLDVLVDEI